LEEDRVGDVWECPVQGAWGAMRRVVTAIGNCPTLNGRRPGMIQYGDLNPWAGGWRNHATAAELSAMGFVKVACGISPHRVSL
jgi:hypothetical protein